MAVAEARTEELVSGEELEHRPDLEPCELIEGRIVPMSPTGARHGEIELRIGARLLAYAESTGAGAAMTGEVGIYIRRNPDTVRAADVVYLSRERDAKRTGTGYLDVAPELVVEILSPDDRWSEVHAKLEDYFSIGIDRVWVVDPRSRRVFTYRSLTNLQIVRPGEELTDPELLPGFSLPVDELFRE